MPPYKNINTYLDQIQNNKTPVLGLSLKSHAEVNPGVYIPKAGMYALSGELKSCYTPATD